MYPHTAIKVSMAAAQAPDESRSALQDLSGLIDKKASSGINGKTFQQSILRICEDKNVFKSTLSS